ncbi:MAG: Proteolipid protein 2 [Ramalina farinacea]|uniref:Proteolipid protein 2 n=1 Tax=Ramalina farinacea TaxID=258253 RepID=A0AA43TWM1_9LECA|nr:Proteolipid protein 2 [Ramalina farinacea]
MNMPVNVPVDDPNADTEWNDILRKHGVIPEKPPSPTPMIQEALREAQKEAHENRLEDKDLDELNDLEDEEDEAFLDQYRQQRLAELSEVSNASIFNQVYHLQKPDYSKDVTEASHNAFVFVHLTSSLGTNIESRVLTELWREMARTFGDIKFCEIKADMCIENYPERNTPTILVYKDGDIKRQIVTLIELGGARTSMKDLEGLLADVGAIKPKDHRIVHSISRAEDVPYNSIRSGKMFSNSAATTNEDDD